MSGGNHSIVRMRAGHSHAARRGSRLVYGSHPLRAREFSFACRADVWGSMFYIAGGAIGARRLEASTQGVPVLHEPSPVMQENNCPVVVITSGQTLKISRVKIYEAAKLQDIALLKASAAKNLGEISTGIGFWGSPAWALGGAAALGMIEGILSNAARKQGIELLRTAQAKFHELANGALYFDAAKLANSHVPSPHAWSAIGTATRYIDLSQLNWLSRESLMRQHNKDESDVENVYGLPCIIVREPGRQYIHDGDEFVNVETNIGTINIRWSHVVAYFPPQALARSLEMPQLSS